MTRRTITMLTLTAVLLALAAPALAQNPADVAAEVRDRGYYIEPGLSADAGRISDAISEAGNRGVRLFVVLLDDDPGGGSTTFADAVLDRIGDGTVLVLSAESEGMASFDFGEAQREAALDAGFAASAAGGDAAYVEAVVASLTGAPVDSGGSNGNAVPAESSSGGGSKTGLIVMLVIIGGLILLVVWAIRRSKTSAERGRQNAIAEARKEIKAQLDAMANTILDITDEVMLSDSKKDNEYLQAAGSVYTEAAEAWEAADDLNRLEALSDQIDEARWQLDAAAAIAQDKPVPSKPKKEERHACFFDPTHRAPFEEAEIHTGAGNKKVWVCAADAAKLRRGEQPDPRLIEVGGRRIPAPSAPKSHGGGGFDWLDVFSVIVGGMGTARSYDWGGAPRTTGGGSIFRRRSSTPSAPTPSSTRTRGRSGRRRTRRR